MTLKASCDHFYKLPRAFNLPKLIKWHNHSTFCVYLFKNLIRCDETVLTPPLMTRENYLLRNLSLILEWRWKWDSSDTIFPWTMNYISSLKLGWKLNLWKFNLYILIYNKSRHSRLNVTKKGYFLWCPKGLVNHFPSLHPNLSYFNNRLITWMRILWLGFGIGIHNNHWQQLDEKVSIRMRWKGCIRLTFLLLSFVKGPKTD